MKNSRILLSFILIIAAFSLYSCGADEPVDGFVENSEPTTPGGGGDGDGNGGTTAGVFAVDFNGSTWTAATTQAEVSGQSIQILAVKPNGETFGILVNATTTGTYPANQNILGYSPSPLSNALTNGYLGINKNNPLENTGSVTITSINTINKTISGTFNFKGYWTDNTKTPIEFTNGSFTNLSYTGTNPTTGGGTTGAVLLKKTISTDSDGAQITTTYNYNGNKIVSSIDDSGESNIYVTYTGDLITKIEYKLPSGTIEQVDLYTYNSNGKLSSYLRIDMVMKWGTKEVYTHNSDGSISVKNFIGDNLSQTQEDGGGTIKFLNGEISEIVNTNSPKMTYLFDAKNNPFKNVTGMDKIAFTAGIGDGILHNVISETYDADVFTTTYIYNSDSYPVSSIYMEYGKKTATQYFY